MWREPRRSRAFRDEAESSEPSERHRGLSWAGYQLKLTVPSPGQVPPQHRVPRARKKLYVLALVLQVSLHQRNAVRGAQ